MSVAVDTSAYLALASPDDARHQRATQMYHRLLAEGQELVTTAYVVLETVALLQRRIGLDAARAFRMSLSGATRIIWVDRDLHEAAWDELERVGRRDVSLADCCLAVAAQREGIADVFAFDPHFQMWGLRPVHIPRAEGH